MNIDTAVHQHRSADGRYWSSQELCDLADGRIDEDECKRRYRERQRSGEAYLPRTKPPAWLRQMFLEARLRLDRAGAKE